MPFFCKKKNTDKQQIAIEDKYVLKELLGTGAFSEVKLAESKDRPAEFYAVKIIDKKALKGI